MNDKPIQQAVHGPLAALQHIFDQWEHRSAVACAERMQLHVVVAGHDPIDTVLAALKQSAKVIGFHEGQVARNHQHPIMARLKHSRMQPGDRALTRETVGDTCITFDGIRRTAHAQYDLVGNAAHLVKNPHDHGPAVDFMPFLAAAKSAAFSARENDTGDGLFAGAQCSSGP